MAVKNYMAIGGTDTTNVLLGPSDANSFTDIPLPQNVLPGASDAYWPSMSNEEDLSDCESDPDCHPRSQTFYIRRPTNIFDLCT